MNSFTLPFIIESASNDYLISKVYEENESYFLKIPKNTQVEEVITIKIKPTGVNLDFKLKIELEVGSSAIIIEDWTSEVKSETINLVHHIECKDNSRLKYIILSSPSDETSITEERSSNVHSDAQCDIYSYYFSSKKIDSKLVQRAVGRGAHVFTDVIAKSEKEQSLNFNYEHQYLEKNGNGEIGMKAIAQDRGMLNFDGMVNIAKTGGGSAGYLQQETLNLSPHTVVKATPGLKIDTNDVKAGHGASIRNLNDEDLYYFAARGIDSQTAKNLLIRGFLGSELEKIEKWEHAYERVKSLI